MITAQDAQDALDLWWQNAKDPRASKIRAVLAKKWDTPDAGYVRVTIVDGADLLGTAIRIELERQDHTKVIRETRPTTTNQFGFTLDDIEDFGVARRERTIRPGGAPDPQAR